MNEEYPIDDKMQGRSRGGLVEWITGLDMAKLKEFERHLKVDPATGQRSVTLPNFTITFSPPE